MKRELLDFLKEVQSDKRLTSFDEPALKQGVVLRILSFLGWDPFNIDEIHPEYRTESGKVDFSLMHDNSNRVFVAAKKVGVNLEKHQEELLSFSLKDGVVLAVLTNGINWWFSLPLVEGDWEEKRFETINVYEQDPDDTSQIFTDFLSKQNVISGKALKKAEAIYETRQSTVIIKETLPNAWNQIVGKPASWFVEKIAEETEKLCGRRPDKEMVKEFIASEIQLIASDLEIRTPVSTPSRPLPSPPQQPTAPPPTNADYTGKSIDSFTFKKKRYDVGTWNMMLLKICEIILSAHKDRFEYLLTLTGPKRPYFSKTQQELLTSEKIAGSDIYVEVNIGAMGVVRLSYKIIKLFGYQDSDLTIEVK